MYQLKSAEKQLKKQETDNANQIEELEGTNNELQALLDDYETDIDSFNNKISQKDELIDDLNSKLEVLKEQAESFNLDQKQKLETQAVQNQVYIKDLREQIKSLEEHLSEEKQTGDTKNKELEEELAKVKKVYVTKLDMKQQEMNQLNNDLVEVKVQSEKQQEEITVMKNSQKEMNTQLEDLKIKSQDLEKLSKELKELQASFTSLESDKNTSTEKYKDEQTKRKLLLNELEDIKGKIRVYCRMRPFSNSEKDDPEKASMNSTINDQLSVTVHGRIDNTYNFNSVFGPNTS